MKAPDLTMLCLMAAVAAMAAQARSTSLREGSSSNVARVRAVVTNTTPRPTSPRDITTIIDPVRVPVQTPARAPGTSRGTSSASDVLPGIAGGTKIPVTAEQTKAPVPSSKNYAVSARVLVSGVAARKRAGQTGNPGFADLAGAETNLVDHLGYRDYRLISSDRNLVSQSDTYQLAFDTTSSVVIKPLYETGGKIRTEVTWRMPGQDDWTIKIFIHRGRSLTIGGPKIEGGGIYLLSLTIK